MSSTFFKFFENLFPGGGPFGLPHCGSSILHLFLQIVNPFP